MPYILIITNLINKYNTISIKIVFIIERQIANKIDNKTPVSNVFFDLCVVVMENSIMYLIVTLLTITIT